MNPIDWPTPVVERILLFLALDGAERSWYQLSFMTINNHDLKKRAQEMPRPLVIRAEIDGREEYLRNFCVPFRQSKISHVKIDWGDGSVEIFDGSDERGVAIHEYDTGGAVIIRVFPHGPGHEGIWLDHLGWRDENDCIDFAISLGSWGKYMRSLDSLGSLGISNLSCAFLGAKEFDHPLEHLDTRRVVNMKSMFQGAKKFNQPLSRWNVSNVTNMSAMFESCLSFNQDLNDWTIDQVTRMDSMFSKARRFNLEHVSSWNLSPDRIQNLLAKRAPFKPSRNMPPVILYLVSRLAWGQDEDDEDTD